MNHFALEKQLHVVIDGICGSCCNQKDKHYHYPSYDCNKALKVEKN